jgi:hypothetical protein
MRITLAGVLAVTVGGGLMAFVAASLVQQGREPARASVAPKQQNAADLAPDMAAPPSASRDESHEFQSKGPLVSTTGSEESLEQHPPAETPIEEILAESGEDPGAVLLMNRVREAVREGNPAFARELLQHMRREHENSILVLEAERLLE